MGYIDRVSLNNEIYNVRDAFGRAIIANEFDSEQEYSEGDLVLYGENLYKCLSGGSGSWDFNNWSLTTLVENLGGGDSSGGDIDALIERTIVSYSGSCSTIGSYTFNGCSSLQLVNFPNCTTVGLEAFSGCKKLQSVSFPQCSFIGAGAFSSCSSLQSVSFPECSTISREAFKYCSSLQSINFPQCTSVMTSAFYGCKKLQSISFPNCTWIDNGAFTSCSSLQSVSFPQCSRIASYAFNNCFSLQLVSSPECSIIGLQAFISCSSLQSISLPKCWEIGSSAFRGCTSLSAIYLLLSSKTCNLSNSNAFASTPIALSSYLGYFGSIYVPSSLVSFYKNGTNWTYYSDRITAYVP